MTTKLDEMWAALAAYQPQADAAGHGESWARMCANKTSDAAAAAYDAAATAYAAADPAYDPAVVYWAQKAIDLIKKITAPPAALEQDVFWGVDWGKAGDKACVSIIKRLPNGKIEVVAVEYQP